VVKTVLPPTTAKAGASGSHPIVGHVRGALVDVAHSGIKVGRQIPKQCNQHGKHAWILKNVRLKTANICWRSSSSNNNNNNVARTGGHRLRPSHRPNRRSRRD